MPSTMRADSLAPAAVEQDAQNSVARRSRRIIGTFDDTPIPRLCQVEDKDFGVWVRSGKCHGGLGGDCGRVAGGQTLSVDLGCAADYVDPSLSSRRQIVGEFLAR